MYVCVCIVVGVQLAPIFLSLQDLSLHINHLYIMMRSMKLVLSLALLQAVAGGVSDFAGTLSQSDNQAVSKYINCMGL